MPMPGVVIAISVSEGQAVKRGDPLLVVEAMKMEHTLRAPRDGKVRRLAASNGQRADAGAVLLEVSEL
jgi:biotin carboxyl carrier protein